MTEFLPLKVDLPSRYLFYPTMKEMYTRKLTIKDFKNLIHVLKSNNPDNVFNGVKNIIQDCSSTDINDLTPKDFIYLMYYIREISFPKNPMIVTWMSHYGNILQTKVNFSKLEIVNPEITQEELNAYLLKGYAVPRMKDINAEIFNDILKTDFSKPGTNIFDHIEIFFAGKDEAEKTANLEKYSENMDLNEIVDEIDEFYKKIDHGILEYVVVSDEGFDANKWVKKLEAKIKDFDTFLDSKSDITNMTLAVAVRDKLKKEYDEIIETLKNGGSVTPITESVFLPKGFDIFLSNNILTKFTR